MAAQPISKNADGLYLFVGKDIKKVKRFGGLEKKHYLCLRIKATTKYMKDSINREQNDAGISSAERENARPQVYVYEAAQRCIASLFKDKSFSQANDTDL